MAASGFCALDQILILGIAYSPPNFAAKPGFFTDPSELMAFRGIFSLYGIVKFLVRENPRMVHVLNHGQSYISDKSYYAAILKASSASHKSTKSLTVQSRSVTPAAIAGVTRSER